MVTLRIKKEKWILYRHISDFDKLCTVAKYLKSFSKTGISVSDKAELNQLLREYGLYSERNPNLPLDAINHKINQLSYYLFGYQAKVEGKDRFMFSPLGNLFLKNIDSEEKSSKIFLSMLWGVQFQHPHSGTDKTFQLYPFRLIFKLLMDKRLGLKLFAHEVAYYVVFLEKATIEEYECLVQKILYLRTLSDEKIAELFQENPHAYVNAVYEWDYYVSKLFNSAGVLDKFEGGLICLLKHGTSTIRKLKKNWVQISSGVRDLSLKLNEQYPYDAVPLKLNDPERMKLDVVKEIYNFYPEVLLEEIGLKENKIKLELLKLPKLIEQYSNNTDGIEAYLFEDALTAGFNLFYNVDARKIGGAGNTDIECLYDNTSKFAVDAKSTKNKLGSINAGRLAGHRAKIGAKYSIVVAPRYVPAVLGDIVESQIVIMRASTLSEYLSNCIDNDIREINYAEFHNIIKDNMGTDISHLLSDLTIEKFASKR